MVDSLGKILKRLPEAPWYPQTGPQSLAYLSEADELFYGGAGGCGKSDLILGLGMTAQVSSLVLRLQSSQLVDFKKRVHQLMSSKDRWQGVGAHGGILRTVEGRQIEFNGCENILDANKKFRGRPNDGKFFDELPTIPKDVYEFVSAWTRTDIAGQRTRIVGTGNPPSKPEEFWVIDRWAPWLRDFTAEPGELRWFARLDGEDKQVENGKPFQFKKELIYPSSRTFIPGTLSDNPILEATGYRQTLQKLPEPLRSQLLYGDMKIGLSDDAHQLIPLSWIEAAMRRWEEKEVSHLDLTCTGIDPARGGSNRSVMAKRYGNWVSRLLSIPGIATKNGPELAARMILHIENMWKPIIIDLTGTAGGGLLDSMRLLYPKLPTYGFVASGKSEYRDNSGLIKMRNQRTEAYWRLRDALDPQNGFDLALPPDDDLKLELTVQRWYQYPSGAGLLDKDEITKLLQGRSPDKADALAMTFMDSQATSGWVATEPKLMQTFMGGVDPASYLTYRDPWSNM